MKNKLVRQGQLIKETVAKQSASRLDALHGLKTFTSGLGSLSQNFSFALLSKYNDYSREPIDDWHPHIHTMMQILENQVSLLSRMFGEIGKGITNISREVELHIEALSMNNQSVWKQLSEYQRQLKTFCEPEPAQGRRKPSDTSEPSQYSENHQIELMVSGYKKTLSKYNRVNESTPNLIKNSIGKVAKEVNKLLGDSGVVDFVDDLVKDQISVRSIQKVVVEVVYDTLGSTDLMCEQRRMSSRTPTQFKRLEEFADYFVSSRLASAQQFMDIRGIILDNQAESEYFLSLLSHKIKGEVSLNKSKYQDLLSIVKTILGTHMESDNNEHVKVVVEILNMSTRICHNNQYLIGQLRKYQEYWKSEGLWLRMFKAVGKQQKHDKPVNIRRLINKIPIPNNKRIQGIKAFSISQISRVEKWLGLNIDEKEEERVYGIMSRINVYLTKLELDSEFTMGILSRLAKDNNLNKHNLERLIKFQYLYRRKELDKSSMGTKTTKARKEKEYEEIANKIVVFAIRGSLGYLSLQDNLLELRRVNRVWRNQLTHSIYRRFLQQESNMDKVAKYRLSLYKIFANTRNFSEQKYLHMVESVPKDQPQREIIRMDVRRSLAWKPSLQQKLFDILITFAYQHPEIGYLQGMNYLAEHILRLTQGPDAYKIFQHQMVNQYDGVFHESFDLLKMKIYQLLRLMEFYLPRLFNHFMTQGIQGEHFLIAWAITLWGEYPGEITWVMSDGFIMDGWKWWMQVCLWFFSHQQEKLLSMDFQGIMGFFSQLAKTPMFSCPIKQIPNTEHFKSEILSFKVTNQLLEEMRKEYSMSLKKIKEL